MFRWASNRVKERGVICFVSNGSFIDSNSMDGLRKCLLDDFTSIYCFNLRGDQRTSGEVSRREGGKIFGSGSRAQIAITLLVKNPDKKGKCVLHYHDIGDYLTREQKLELISGFAKAQSIPWTTITPNESHDWINQRDEAFSTFMPVGSNDTKGEADSKTLFVNYSQGILTARDAWAYNFSKKRLADNMRRTIEFYNQQVAAFQKQCSKGHLPAVEKFIDRDAKKISWTGNLKGDVVRNKKGQYDDGNLRQSSYRPFCVQYLYYGRQFNERVYRMPDVFPTPDTYNVVICISGVGASSGFSALITDKTPCYDYAPKSQCFPLRNYKAPKVADSRPLEFGDDAEIDWQLNVSNYALKRFRGTYENDKLTGEDIFYYVYGVFHSPEYKRRFGADLSKMLPHPLCRGFLGI